MFWELTALSAASPVESILDKEDFTLEELLDEEDIIQECRALNIRLINFLRENADSKRAFKCTADLKSCFSVWFPFISSEVLTCEIDAILKTLVEEEELMNLLFSFLEPNRSHSVILTGYFSKVVICLMLRKTVPLINYVKTHQNVFHQLVDLIGIMSIMEILIRLVGADDHVYPNHMDVMQWLADSNLLEMVVDKLSLSNSLEVHANAAETPCTVAQNAPSPLATKLSSSSFIARIFGHAFGDPQSKSSLVHTLSVCISLLSPRRSLVSSYFMYSFRGQQIFESPISVNPETIATMVPRLGDFVKLLNATSDEKVLPTMYGQLRPSLGSHRLKIVEFIAILVLDLFFKYPYNNALHHQVESIIVSCLESKNDEIVDHLLHECDLIGKILKIEKQPILSSDNQPTIPAAGKQAPRVGNIGHISRISNKLVQLSTNNNLIKTFLIHEHNEWGEWEANKLHDRNALRMLIVGRPTALHDRSRNKNNGAGKDHGSNDRDEEMTNLLNNLFTNSNWFTFQGDELGDNTGTEAILSEEAMEDVSLNETSGNGTENDEEDCWITEGKNPFVATASTLEAEVTDPFPADDMKIPDVRVPNGSSSSEGEVSPKSPPVPSLFGKDVEYVGVEPEGTERAMDQALKEGILGEAGPMKRNSATDSPEKERTDENIQEYTDTVDMRSVYEKLRR
ncbi:BnaCnng15910D [Brassica napus]|uniref:BnaCnng15910D protein n=3 Tax=Brassica TaxID=3705 RepID=A0A078IFQ4_BRANA|nr:BnaCnng15910D [Brassica napus]